MQLLSETWFMLRRKYHNHLQHQNQAILRFANSIFLVYHYCFFQKQVVANQHTLIALHNVYHCCGSVTDTLNALMAVTNRTHYATKEGNAEVTSLQ